LKRLLFRLAALLLPLFVLLLLEGAARLAGYGGDPPLIRRVAEDGDHAWYATNRAGTNAFFRGRATAGGGMRELQFRTPKLPGTVRIVFVGESAIQGFPQPLPLTNGSFLEAMLFDAWHGERRPEVLNLGATAMASYPVTRILDAALAHQPDLVVAMTGNNEYYGAYGVLSLPPFARSPLGLQMVRAVRSLALSQWLEARFRRAPETGGALMERLAGGGGVAPESPLRQAAAATLRGNLDAMVARCRRAGVPILLCTSPTNEHDLHPIGETTGPAADAFAQARRLEAEGQADAAAAAYRRARDLDPMPWRATSALNDAVRAAAAAGAILCDMEAAFRRASPGGAIGRELLDDHVHFSLRGQALYARTIAEAMTALPGPLHVEPAELERLPGLEDYEAALGHTPYSDYLAATHLKTLFDIPFMRQANEAVARRAADRLDSLRNAMPPADRIALDRWRDPALHGASDRPVEFVVGVYRMEAGDYAGAADLFRVARVSVSLLSLWRLEIDARLVTCSRYLNDAPTDEDMRLLREAQHIGRLLVANGRESSPELTRWLGVVRQLGADGAARAPALLGADSTAGR
jgi:hypothetical protein